jgi:hypothetical protein
MGRDFCDTKRARIDFVNRVIQMSKLEVKFNEKVIYTRRRNADVQ